MRQVWKAIVIVGGAVAAGGAEAGAQCADWLAGPMNPVAGSTASRIYAFAPFVGRMVGAGEFNSTTTAGSPSVANNVMGWDGVNSFSYGSGFNAPVRCLLSYNVSVIRNNLVAGGEFTTAGGVSANRVALWSDSIVIGSNAWTPMGAGFNGTVYALERFNNSVYAAGAFTASGGTTVNRVARFDGANWVPLNGLGGLNGTAYALKAYNGRLYIGGEFTVAGGTSCGGLVAFDGANFQSVGGFFSGTVLALEPYNGSLAIGGLFAGFGGSPNISTYNAVSGSYGNLGAGGTTGVSPRVKALVADGVNLYAGGDFMTIGGVTANFVGRWNGSSWGPVQNGTNGSVLALEMFRGEVHAGGIFFAVDNNSVPSQGWARFSPTGAPWVSGQPASISLACPGSTANFSATPASGFGPGSGATYAWRRGGGGPTLADGPTGTGSTIAGANTLTLSIANVSPADAGPYELVVSNSCGSGTSSAATLAVCRVNVNCDGGVDSGDITAFLSRWFADRSATPPTTNADFDASGATNSADITAFLSAWFSARSNGC